MTSDMGELFNEHKRAMQKRRADNRQGLAKILIDRGVAFESKNGGAHLLVQGKNSLVDFWPGTGKWHSRSGEKGFGVQSLLIFLDEAAGEKDGREE